MRNVLATIILFAATTTLGCGGAAEAQLEAGPDSAVELPPAIVDYVWREAKGGRRSQVRAVIRPQVHSQVEIEQFSRMLAEKHGLDHALVTFFDDTRCFLLWDGKGSLVDHEWPHCLCRVLIDGDETVFNLFVDESTSQARTDVLREQQQQNAKKRITHES